MPPSPLHELTNFLLFSEDDTLELAWDRNNTNRRRECFYLERLLRWDEYFDFATDFCEFQDAVKKNKTIRKLVLTFVYSNESCLSQAFWIINTLYRHLPNVSTLRVGKDWDVRVYTTENPLDFVLRGTDRFEEIGARYGRSSAENLQFEWGWLKPQTKLQELDLCAFGSTSLSLMAAALAPISNLKYVKITDSKLRATEETDLLGPIESVGAITAFFQLSTLRTLYLSSIEFTNEDLVEAFAQGISDSSIEGMNLHYSCSTPTQYSRMADGIANCLSLRELSLRNTGRSFDAPFPLARLLRSNSDNMTYLNLEQYFNVPDEDVEEMALGMLQGTVGGSLDQLSLSFATPVQLCLFLTALRECTCLVTVLLSCDPRPLDEEIVQRIDALRNAPSLKSLFILFRDPTRLDPSSLDPALELELERCLSQNFQMEHIILPWLNRASHDRLETMCELNRFGRGYLLSATPSKADGVELLAKHSRASGNHTRQLDFIFTHLRENPGLCSHDDDFANHSVGNSSS